MMLLLQPFPLTSFVFRFITWPFFAPKRSGCLPGCPKGPPFWNVGFGKTVKTRHTLFSLGDGSVQKNVIEKMIRLNFVCVFKEERERERERERETRRLKWPSRSVLLLFFSLIVGRETNSPFCSIFLQKILLCIIERLFVLLYKGSCHDTSLLLMQPFVVDEYF